jgi:16S rRNA (cytidine1402-2'-O)-methyltransferase
MHQSTGKLYVVATPIGNLADLSDRAKETLSQVTWVAAEDTRHSSGLLNAIGASPTLLSYHDHNEHARIEGLILRLQNGESGALISDAGTPLISDPGYGLVLQAHEAKIPVVPIPGPCSPIVALSASGLPTDKFLFEGFLPAKTAARIKRFEELKHFPYTTIYLEAPHRILDFMKEALSVFGAQRRVCIARELTKKFESIILLSLQEMVNAFVSEQIPQKGEFVVIIEGASSPEQNEVESEMNRVLGILLPEMPLKQAVQIAAKLTGYSKNQLYDLAIRLK